MMQALQYLGPEKLGMVDVPKPVPGEGDALVRITASGICGSDMHAFLGHDARRPAPLILGHEAAGIVEGGDMDGRRVAINPLATCGVCHYCQTGRTNICADRQIISMPPREGAFAQYVAMPVENLVTVPDGFDLTRAALVEPIACGWHAARLALATLPDPRNALVIGGGPIGVGAALSLRALGVADVEVSEPNPTRVAFLETCDGIDLAGELSEYDIVIDGVGYAATRATASAHAAPGGVIAHIGLGGGDAGLDVRRMTLQEITFIGTYTYTAQDFRDTATAMFDGRLGPLDWIETRPLAEGTQAFDDIRGGRVPAPKIILIP